MNLEKTPLADQSIRTYPRPEAELLDIIRPFLLLLFLLLPARAQVVKTPVVEAGLGGVSGSLGAAGSGAALPQPALPSPSLSQNTLALPSPMSPAVAAPQGPAAISASPAHAAAQAAAGSAVPAVAASPAGAAGPAAAAAPGERREDPEVEAVLAEIFDGSREKLELSSLVDGRFEPAVYGKGHVSDERYAAALDSARKGFEAPSGPTLERVERRGLQASNALLERMRSTDEPTYAHMMRVGLLTGLIAQKMGLGKAETQRLVWAAAMHDVGKSDPEILAAIRKPGKLTPEDRAVVNKHPAVGAQLLAGLRGIPSSLKGFAVGVALNHHEKFDGSGYPNGLKGTDIPLASRIIAVADVFDALMEDRPYRAGMSWEKAASIMKEMAPGHFDPEVFRAFLALTERALPVPAGSAP